MPAKTDYRPNPRRAIIVQGMIDQGMVNDLTPQIIALQAASTEPITVYIDSPGGVVACARRIRSLLFSPNLDSVACRVLTVVTGTAASAAALLLSSGNYSLAYPDCRIHYHGTRLPGVEVTLTRATDLTEDPVRVTNRITRGWHDLIRRVARP